MMRPTGRPRAPPRLLHLRSAAMRPCSTVASGGPLPAAAAAVATTSRSLPVVDPSDTAKVFRTRGTTDLLGTASLLQLCSSPAVVSALCRVLVYAAESRSTVLAPLLWVTRRTVFPHFAAGEVLMDARDTAQRLQRLAGARCIVDYSTEEAETVDALEQNLQSKMALLRQVATTLPEEASFVSVKLTALVDPVLLEGVTSALLSATDESSSGVGAAASAERGVLGSAELSAAGLLCDAQLAALAGATARLAALAETSRECGLRLLLDAEQTDRQPAINLLARELMAVTNSAEDGKPPIVYNTFQMYLGDDQILYGRCSLDAELRHAQEAGFTLGAKVVRGAYIASETEAGRGGRLQPCKAATDSAYDGAVQKLLEVIAARDTDAAVVVATHNEESVMRAVDVMRRTGLPADHPHVHFAQILGMADHLTYALGTATTPGWASSADDATGGAPPVSQPLKVAAAGQQNAGFNATKLLVFGEFYEVLPWLLRRLVENQDVLGAAARERALLWAELRRRAMSGGTSSA